MCFHGEGGRWHGWHKDLLGRNAESKGVERGSTRMMWEMSTDL